MRERHWIEDQVVDIDLHDKLLRWEASLNEWAATDPAYATAAMHMRAAVLASLAGNQAAIDHRLSQSLITRPQVRIPTCLRRW